MAPAANPAPKPVLVAETAPKAPPAAQSPTKPIIAAKPEITQPAPQAPTVPELGFSTPAGASSTFASTTKQPAGQFSLRPALIKAPSPPRDPTALAAPLLTDAKTASTVTKSPELLIHSWKSEIATCPWNPDHRLLRIVIQLPSNQSAVTTAKNASYPVSISFDPLSVKQYRLLSERHLPAADLSSAGTQIIWYEFQPNSKSDINSKTGRQIASVSVFGARFTTQAVGPFDSSRLQVLDRGYTLENARDDFVFESAVIGFGLLMRGAEQVGHLDHDLVLDLARRAKNSATSDERTRFIRLLEDTRRAIGLGL
ncbi:MAG: DUF3520 domain-containing protein [Verrucomicrobiaceae bacterium]|nr:DUF3520 domain-containing protein [Verrucomicrobiaceae bacterium]